MIGAAIFVVSGAIIGTAGPSSFLSFLIAGVATLTVALSFSKLVTTFPESSGGIYAYPKKVVKKYGKQLSFLAGWCLWGGQGLGPAIVGLSFAYYLTWLLDILGLSFTIERRIIAILIIFVLGAFNSKGTNLSKRIQAVTTFSIVVCLLIFCLTGVFHIDTSNFTPFLPYGTQGLLKASAMASLTYGAWSTIPNASQEFSNPKRDVPRSMIFSLVTCSVLFMFVILIQSGLCHYTSLLNASAPLATAAYKITKNAGILIAFAGLFATASTLNGLIFTGSRLLASMGKSSLPQFLKKKHKTFHTPYMAILCTVAGQIILVITGLFLLIVEMVVFVTTVSWIIGCVSTLVLNYKTEGKITSCILPFVALIFCVILCTTLDTRAIQFGVLWIVLGLGVQQVYEQVDKEKIKSKVIFQEKEALEAIDRDH